MLCCFFFVRRHHYHYAATKASYIYAAGCRHIVMPPCHTPYCFLRRYAALCCCLRHYACYYTLLRPPRPRLIIFTPRLPLLTDVIASHATSLATWHCQVYCAFVSISRRHAYHLQLGHAAGRFTSHTPRRQSRHCRHSLPPSAAPQFLWLVTPRHCHILPCYAWPSLRIAAITTHNTSTPLLQSCHLFVTFRERHAGHALRYITNTGYQE